MFWAWWVVMMSACLSYFACEITTDNNVHCHCKPEPSTWAAAWAVLTAVSFVALLVIQGLIWLSNVGLPAQEF